jgi:hypothetical protein
MHSPARVRLATPELLVMERMGPQEMTETRPEPTGEAPATKALKIPVRAAGTSRETKALRIPVRAEARTMGQMMGQMMGQSPPSILSQI